MTNLIPYAGLFWTLNGPRSIYRDDKNDAPAIGMLAPGDCILFVRHVVGSEWKVLTRMGLVNIFIGLYK